MKKNVARLLMGAALTALLAVTASAQIVTMRLNIPFDFKAGGQAYPAGEYKIELVSAHPSILVSNVETRKTSFLLPQIRQSAALENTTGHLRFHKFADGYVLREIVSLGGAHHYQWAPTRQEREAERKGGFEVAQLRPLP